MNDSGHEVRSGRTFDKDIRMPTPVDAFEYQKVIASFLSVTELYTQSRG